MFEESKLSVTYQNQLINFGYGVSYPPFARHDLHTHSQCEIFCVHRGNGHYITEGSRRKFEPGRIFLMRPGEIHMAEMINDIPREATGFHFAPSIVDSFDPERKLLAPFFDRPLGLNNVYDRPAVSQTEIYSLFQKMRSLDLDNDSNCIHGTALLISVLSELKQLFDAQLYTQSENHVEMMHGVIDYVNRNLANDLTSDYLCKKFHLSRAQLDRNFKHYTGSTVWAYITAKRLLLAKSYIAEGMHATEAATVCGFKDYSTFYRAYRKHFGQSPTAPEKPNHKITLQSR